MSWTGKLLVRCFNRMRPQRRTYPAVGLKSFGNYGLYFVSFGIVPEFFGSIGVNLIFLWQNIEYLFDSTDFGFTHTEYYSISNIAITSCVCVLPLCLILNLSEMSFISFLGCICKILTVILYSQCLPLKPLLVCTNFLRT